MSDQKAAIHLEILRTAQDLCRKRKDWRFRMKEIVDRLPHLKATTLRTHIGSRCCVNAPKNHPHKWDYFKRVGHGEFEILSKYRARPIEAKHRVAEPVAAYGARASAQEIATIHAVVTQNADHDEAMYTATCLEVAVVTQGRTFDELLGNLCEAVRLHIDGDAGRLGVAADPRLSVIFEMSVPPA